MNREEGWIYAWILDNSPAHAEGELEPDECNCDSDTAWRLQIPCPVH